MRGLPFAAAIVSGVMIASAVRSGEQALPSVDQSLTPEKGSSPRAQAKAADRAERPIFIAIPPLLESLKRAPVLFQHDKHTVALKDEGCEVCHPRQAGKFDFSFFKGRDERNRDAFMDSFHDACMGCHTRRSGEGKKTGPVTCGECHADQKAYRPEAYVPVLPEYYDALRDTYHKDCVACHQKPGKHVADARELDWKRFYVSERRKVALKWPKIVFDYYVHDKHLKTLEKKCELCHYLSPELKQKLASEGKEPTSQDWLRQEQKGESLKERESAHRRCLNCHLERRAEKKELAGPVDCKDCHVDRLRSPKELEKSPPPDYDKKKERVLIQAENARLPAVPFDHKSHIAASRSCDDCHHDTLESCKTCHGLKGTKEGNFITLSEAYHDRDSKWSCVGCHAQEAKKPDCAGCHHLRKDSLAASSCASCHTGKLESLDQAVKLPDPATLFLKDLKDELVISAIEKEYEPCKVKHRDIARKLTEISNNSKLATFFHKEETTLCVGCHHLGPVEKGRNVPACSTCHTVRNEPSGSTPTLLGAYHQMCLGCHREMGYPEEKMPQDCAGCHKEKKKALPGSAGHN